MAKKKSTPQPVDNRTLYRWLAWAVCAGVWFLIAAALLSYDPADRPGHQVVPHNAQIQNWVGLFGAVVSYRAYLMIGPGVWIAMVGALAALVTTARGKTITQPALRTIGVILMAFAVSAMLGLSNSLSENGLPFIHRPEGAGGLIAIYINGELHQRFAVLGTTLILITGFWIGAVLAADRIVLALPRLIGRWLNYAAERIHLPNPVLVGKLPALVGALWPRKSFRGIYTDVDEGIHTPRRPRVKPTRKRKDISENDGGFAGTESFDPTDNAATAVINAEEESWEYEEADDEGYEVEQSASATEHDEDEADAGADAPAAYIEEKKRFNPDELREKIKNLPINMASPFKDAAPPPAPEIDLTGYEFPGMDLLEEPESNFNEEMEALVRDQAVQLEEALQEYRIEGEVVGIDSGPAITLFEIRLAPGTKVSRISAVSSDIARAMRAQNIRVVPNIPGKDTIGIEVPNIKKEKVRLKELMTVGHEKHTSMNLPMFLGKDASGNPLIADLAAAPHILIAGTTGSGKSVCMNSIIMSFLFTKRPDELKLVLVDPKMVEMSQFKNIPHLMCPVVTEMSKAAAILEWAVTKMDERYELLAEAGVRDISSYNALGWEEIKDRMDPQSEAEEARIPKKLPYLVFIIDELADLMMTNKEVESFIVRIAQKARAVGIHLILATQRPQANVVTGLIKSNMPSRISFKVASGMDSRIVLDQKGAELLLGHGDMMYISPRSSEVVRAQGTLVDDMEIRKSVRFLKKVSQQSFEPQLVQLKQPGMMEDNAERDPLFDDAVRVVLESQRGSVSLLQRRLSIGYGRSSRLIEEIAQAGIIGEYKGSQAREVNMTLEEWDALKEQMEADADQQAKAGTVFDTSAGQDTPSRSSVPAAHDGNDDDDDDDAPLREYDAAELEDEDEEEYEYVDEADAEDEEEEETAGGALVASAEDDDDEEYEYEYEYEYEEEDEEEEV